MVPATLSVVTPVRNGASYLPRMLAALRASVHEPLEIIIADDASTDDSATIAEDGGAFVERLSCQSGAAAARNLAASRARGEILVFVDADVCVHPNALSEIARLFANEPLLSAVMGAYDTVPAANSLISRFRNMLHAFTHRIGHREASTFWTGLGAVRRDAFARVGGFPLEDTLEDVRFGVRLIDAGGTIALEPAIQGTHLKRWTLASMVATDIGKRGIPWTLMALKGAGLRNDLNTRFAQRASVALAGCLALLMTFASLVGGKSFIIPLAALMVALTLPAWPDADTSRPYLRSVLLLGVFGIGATACMITCAAPLATALFVLGVATAAARTAQLPFARKTPSAVFSVLVAAASGAVLTAFPANPWTIAAGLIAGAYSIFNLRFLDFMRRHAGLADAIGSAPFLWIHHICCGTSVVAGTALHLAALRRSGKPGSLHQRFHQPP